MLFFYQTPHGKNRSLESKVKYKNLRDWSLISHTKETNSTEKVTEAQVFHKNLLHLLHISINHFPKRRAKSAGSNRFPNELSTAKSLADPWSKQKSLWYLYPKNERKKTYSNLGRVFQIVEPNRVLRIFSFHHLVFRTEVRHPNREFDLYCSFLIVRAFEYSELFYQI